MIYVIDHKDSFTHNVVHQFSLFDNVECDDFSKINNSKLNQASTIVFSPGPGSPKDYPVTSKIYKKFNLKNRYLKKGIAINDGTMQNAAIIDLLNQTSMSLSCAICYANVSGPVPIVTRAG